MERLTVSVYWKFMIKICIPNFIFKMYIICSKLAIFNIYQIFNEAVAYLKYTIKEPNNTKLINHCNQC